MSTELITQSQAPQSLTVYDRIADPLDFIERMGKVLAHSGACGCETEAQGKLVALACLCERKSPFDIDRRYHLMNGKLSMKSDVMLAELRARGGKHKWIKDGTDGTEAVIELSYDGQTYTSRYTIADAERAKLVKSGGGWEKNPPNMLRARAISNGVRMIAPEIAAGIYTPEEREDISSDNGAAPQAIHRTAEEVAARREELQRMQREQIDSETVVVDPVASERRSEQEPKPTVESASENSDTSSDQPNQPIEPSQFVKDIDQALHQIGMSREDFESRLRQANPEFTRVEDLSPEAAGRLLANLHAKISGATKN